MVLPGEDSVIWRQASRGEVWNVLAAELSSRASVVLVSWVKGHAKQIDIDRGRTTQEDKWGNDGADKLAVAGAQMHPVPSEVLESALQRRDWAICVQQMMVSVLKTRLLIESSTSNDAGGADRGSDNEDSDNEDCMCMKLCDQMSTANDCF